MSVTLYCLQHLVQFLQWACINKRVARAASIGSMRDAVRFHTFPSSNLRVLRLLMQSGRIVLLCAAELGLREVVKFCFQTNAITFAVHKVTGSIINSILSDGNWGLLIKYFLP